MNSSISQLESIFIFFYISCSRMTGEGRGAGIGRTGPKKIYQELAALVSLAGDGDGVEGGGRGLGVDLTQKTIQQNNCWSRARWLER